MSLDLEQQKQNLKIIFSNNLKRYMDFKGLNTTDISNALDIPFSTVSDWVHGKKYPRMDKVQALADYLGVMKSDLTEEKPEEILYTKQLTERENFLLENFNKLTPEEQEFVLRSVAAKFPHKD